MTCILVYVSFLCGLFLRGCSNHGAYLHRRYSWHLHWPSLLGLVSPRCFSKLWLHPWSIEFFLSHHGKMNFQTDQSNASYTETLRSTANLIGRFGGFLFLRWDKQPEIDCSEFEWQALAVSCMRCYIAKNRLCVCGLFSCMFMRRWWCMKWLWPECLQISWGVVFTEFTILHLLLLWQPPSLCR